MAPESRPWYCPPQEGACEKGDDQNVSNVAISACEMKGDDRHQHVALEPTKAGTYDVFTSKAASSAREINREDHDPDVGAGADQHLHTSTSKVGINASAHTAEWPTQCAR